VVILVAALVFLVGWHPRGESAPARSVAVLPFVDLSEDMANEEFADGITEELIARLNRVPDLLVKVGKSPGAAFDLDGSARRSGDRVRVVARLVRANDGAVVWSETYDRAWADIIVVQDEIVGEVARSLEKVLAAGR
jgi:TolB-like protein